MTNRKSTKKALLMSALSLLLCFSMLVGTTFAWFTDSVESGKNQIIAGNLDVELEYKKVVNGQWTAWDTVQGATEIFDPNALWEPGHTEVVCLKVSNQGSLALKYQLGVNIVSETPGINVAGEEFNLSDHLVFKVLNYGDSELTTAVNREWAVKVAGTAQGLKDYNGNTTKLEVGGSDYLVLIVYMPETVGNKANYRGEAVPTIELGVNLYATQVEAESDSYGSDYDADAYHPNFVVTNPDDLNDAMANVKDGDVIQLANNITVTSETATTTNGYIDGIVYTGDKSFTIDLNGYTLSDDGSLNDYLIYLKNNGKNANEITIKNGAITVNSQVWSAIAVNSASYTQTSVLNLDNVIVTVGNEKNWSNDAIRARHGATINLNAGTVVNSVGTAYGVTANYSGVLNINSGAKVVQSESGAHGGNYPFSAVSGTGTVNIYEGAVIESDCYGIHNMTTLNPVINIYGGTITAPNALHASTNGAADQSAYINVYNGTINGALSTYSANGHIVITGGTFTVDPTNYVAEGHTIIENTDGTYTVQLSQESFDAMINNAEAGDTVYVPAGTFTLSGNNNVVIVGSGADTVIDITGNVQNANISNATVTGLNYLNVGADDSVTFTNVVFDGQFGHTSQGVIKGNAKFVGCTFNGGLHIDSSAADSEIVFEDCTFTELCIIKLGGSAHYKFDGCVIEALNTKKVTSPWGRQWVISYGDVTMTDCQIGRVLRAGAQIDIILVDCVDANGAAVTSSIAHSNASPNVVLIRTNAEGALEVPDAKALAGALELGGTIVLTDDITITEVTTVTEDVVVNLNGYKLDASDNTSRPFTVADGATLTINAAGAEIKCGAYGLVNMTEGTLTINGGTFTQETGNNGSFIRVSGDEEMTITLNNVTYKAGTTDSGVIRTSGSNVTVNVVGGTYEAGMGFLLENGSITGAAITATNTANMWPAVYADGDVTVSGCTIKSACHAIAVGGGNTVKVENCDVQAADGKLAFQVFSSGGTIEVVNCTYTGEYGTTGKINSGCPDAVIIIDGVEVYRKSAQ